MLSISFRKQSDKCKRKQLINFAILFACAIIMSTAHASCLYRVIETQFKPITAHMFLGLFSKYE